jgi:hypothetical protein
MKELQAILSATVGQRVCFVGVSTVFTLIYIHGNAWLKRISGSK